MNYELRSYQVTNPWLGLPGLPYIVVPRVTTVILEYMTRATLQIGQDDDALPPLTFSVIALDGTHHACTLYLFECDLTTRISLICRPGRDFYMPARLNFNQTY
jgi:hypothetical protein